MPQGGKVLGLEQILINTVTDTSDLELLAKALLAQFSCSDIAE